MRIRDHLFHSLLVSGLLDARAGEPVPVTSWNADKTQLAVEWQKRKDSFSFTKDPTGRTLLTVKRDGQETVASAAEATTAMDTSGK
jgi:hypothetical protein